MYTSELRTELLSRFASERIPDEDQLWDMLESRPGITGDGFWRAVADEHAPVPLGLPRRSSPKAGYTVGTRRLQRPAADQWASWLGSTIDDWRHNGLLLDHRTDTRRLLVLPVKLVRRRWFVVRPLGEYHPGMDMRLRAAERLAWTHLPTADLADWFPGRRSIAPQLGQPVLQVYTSVSKVVLSNVLIAELQALGATDALSTVVERIPITPAELARRTELQAQGVEDRATAQAQFRAVVSPGGQKLPVQAYCRSCGQPLSDLISVKHGFGPDCWERLTGEARRVLARPVGGLAAAMAWDEAVALTMRLIASGLLSGSTEGDGAL